MGSEMTTEYRWKVDQVLCKKRAFGQENVINTVVFNIFAFDETASVTQNFSFELASGPQGTFVPFDDLTQTVVIAWVKDSLGSEGVDEILRNIDALLTQKREEDSVWLDLKRS